VGVISSALDLLMADNTLFTRAHGSFAFLSTGEGSFNPEALSLHSSTKRHAHSHVSRKYLGTYTTGKTNSQ